MQEAMKWTDVDKNKEFGSAKEEILQTPSTEENLQNVTVLLKEEYDDVKLEITDVKGELKLSV